VACESTAEVLERAQVVFGCTGTDVLQGAQGIGAAKGPRWLLSCSSEDIEFKQLLLAATQSRTASRLAPFADIAVRLGRTEFVVANGGFPVNFDRTPESVASEAIQLTRGLLLTGIVQATSCANNRSQSNEFTQLSPLAQQLVVRTWLSHFSPASRRIAPSVLQLFDSREWIAMNSGGLPVDCPTVDTLLS
jgi:hypothetical protein